MRLGFGTLVFLDFLEHRVYRNRWDRRIDFLEHRIYRERGNRRIDFLEHRIYRKRGNRRIDFWNTAFTETAEKR